MTTRPDPAARAVTGAYRAASDALDERPGAAARAAILAAAARAGDAAPLHVKLASRRWRIPLAAAATVLVSTIAVMVAQRIEHEAQVTAEHAVPPAQGGRVDARDAAAPPTVAAPATPRAPAVMQAPRREAPAVSSRSAPAAAPERARDEASAGRAAGKVTGAAAEPGEVGGAAPPMAAAAPAPARDAQAARAQTEAGAAATASAAHADNPERWLAAILELRRAGRDAEADAELKKLRERYPEFRIPPDALSATGTR